nr:WAT1-related protein At5g64700-like [Aegilops tauschii subsp. strangulata]
MAAAEGSKEETSRRKAERVALPAGMILVQVLTVVTMLLSKAALNGGMQPLVLLVYGNLVAAATVAPLAVVFERVLLATGLYYCALRTTSAAYTVNFFNLIPVVTFLIAVVLQAERISLGTWPGRMKLVGTAVGVAGTMVVSLCKGPHLPLPHLRLSNAHAHASAPAPASVIQGGHDMAVGTLFMCGSCVSYALWFVVQARVAKVFPSRYWSTALTCAAGSLQSAAAAAAATVLAPREGWAAEWRMGWDLRLVTVVYSGVFNTGVTFVLVSWAVARRGPVYPPMFNHRLK